MRCVYFSPIIHDLDLTMCPSKPLTLPRSYKDENSQKQQPGLRNLPEPLRKSFRDQFIRRIIEQVFIGNKPWTNPLLPSLQQDLNRAYPACQIRLHTGDAAVILVSSHHCRDRMRSKILTKNSSENRHTGTSQSFGTELGMKDALRSLNTYHNSITNGHCDPRRQGLSMLRLFSQIPSTHLFGNYIILGVESNPLASGTFMTRYAQSI